MFDVDHCQPLLTLTRVKAPLANRSEIKSLAYLSFFTVRYPVIIQAFNHPNPKPIFAYKLRSYLTKTLDSLS